MILNKKYNVIVVGSGIGGLLCAALLARKGMKVCVVEKNKQLGGNLQTFARDKQLFDTGVHYIGGLEKGQNLYQIFKYVGLMEELKLERMDECFDKILIGNDPTVYCQSQGYDAFVNTLAASFSQERDNIIAYCNKVKEVCASFPLYNLRLRGEEAHEYKGNNESAQEVIASFTTNKKLQAVLAGNNILYAGDGNTTPFHMHALIANSYIESSWKCVGGGSQIAKILGRIIRNHGGDILRNSEVTAMVEEAGVITHIELENGDCLYGDYFISNIHPAVTLKITRSRLIGEVYKKRITELSGGISSFSLHMVLKEGTVPYEKCNYYYHKEGELWNINNYMLPNWPLGYGLYFAEDKNRKGYAATVSVLTPMRYEEVSPWVHTYNRVGKEGFRGANYEAFKKQKATALMNLVGDRFPHIVQNIKSYYTSTPLTNRDYIGDPTGSMYGILKDYHDPLKTMISPRTKIPNLFLTGQNINLHGILGTSLSATLTCIMLLKDSSIIDNIRNA